MDNLGDRATFHQRLFEERFEPLCKKWVKLFNLGNWAIEYKMADVIDNDGEIQAQVHVNAQLGHRATITFASRIGFEDKREVENIIIHEHVHILLDELGQFVVQHLGETHHSYFTRLLEIATSDLAEIFSRMGNNDETKSQGGSGEKTTAPQAGGGDLEAAGGTADGSGDGGGGGIEPAVSVDAGAGRPIRRTAAGEVRGAKRGD